MSHAIPYEETLVSAFLDELEKIGHAQQGDPLEAFNAMFKGGSATDIAELLKQAGALDSLKRFFVGGNQNGIPMMGLKQQLAASNPFQGMGASLASSARPVVDKVKGFVQGGTQNGIPMQSLGQQLAGANPFQGMGQSLRQNVPAAMNAGASRVPMGRLVPSFG